MCMAIRSLCIALMALGCSLSFAQDASARASGARLKLGDKAPEINVAKWIKGEPVKIEKDKVYIVEFWATWCGPCIQTIPHLTKLAKKHRDKVTVVGVSIWESRDATDDSHIPNVERFVKKMGDEMEYHVAADGHQGAMAKAWMEAAGQSAIPTAFVIGKEGTILWIGHPASDLDKVVEQVLDGTYDMKAAAEKLEADRKRDEVFSKLFEKIFKALEANDFKTALTEVDRAIVDHPEHEALLAEMKFNLLLRHDAPAAFKYGWQLLEGPLANNPMALNNMAWEIVEEANRYENADYRLGLAMAKRASELTREEDAYILDTLALAYFRNNDLVRAIAHQAKAVDIAESIPDFDPTVLEEMRERLEMYVKKRDGGGLNAA
jgi:thiol-disulfide isomerase/thioredoxin